MKQSLDAYLCPSNALAQFDDDGYGASSYCGNFGDAPRWGQTGASQTGLYVNAYSNTSTFVTKFSSITDGTSNTIAFGEVGESENVTKSNNGDRTFPVWMGGNNDGVYGDIDRGSAAHIRFAGPDYPINFRIGWKTNLSFGSFHPGGAQFTFADGSVQFLSETIDTTMYGYLGNRSDGNVVARN